MIWIICSNIIRIRYLPLINFAVMKKCLLLLFTYYFFFASTGVVFGTHYCGKKKSHTIWGVSISDSDACKCKGKHPVKSKGCCKNESQWLKADTDDSKAQTSNFQFNKGETVLFLNLFVTLPYFKTNCTKPVLSFQVSHPPPIYELPLFLQVRSILI